MAHLRPAAAVLLAVLAAPALAGSAGASFGVSLRVLPRVRTGLPGGARAAFVAVPGAAALPCGAEGSTACTAAVTEAARQARSPTTPVVVTVLPDGAPTSIVER